MDVPQIHRALHKICGCETKGCGYSPEDIAGYHGNTHQNLPVSLLTEYFPFVRSLKSHYFFLSPVFIGYLPGGHRK